LLLACSFNESLESLTEGTEGLDKEMGDINGKQNNNLRHDLANLGQPKFWKDPLTKYSCETGKLGWVYMPDDCWLRKHSHVLSQFASSIVLRYCIVAGFETID
jgi:hypothetical protein